MKGHPHQKDGLLKRIGETLDLADLEVFLRDEPDPKLHDFMDALKDPAFAELSFVEVARRYQVRVADIERIYTQGMRHLGLMAMARELPAVMAEVAGDARTEVLTCPRCVGAKVVVLKKQGEVPCPVCDGAGTIRKIGNTHARDLVFESMKLTGQKAPMVAIQNTNVVTVDKDIRMESLFKAAASLEDQTSS
jgi:hypothetical protein